MSDQTDEAQELLDSAGLKQRCDVVPKEGGKCTEPARYFAEGHVPDYEVEECMTVQYMACPDCALRMALTFCEEHALNGLYQASVI